MAPSDVAIVGMAARFPGAPDVFDFWKNLRGGVESIRSLSEQELLDAGVDRETLRKPNFVRRAAELDRMEQFDAKFFGISKREADVLDPQQRHFLEVCFEALEGAGIVPEQFAGAIGVFGGAGTNMYLLHNLLSNPELMSAVGLFLARNGNDKDYLTTRVSYCLNLTGPSVNVQTACSTSLVAIHLAVQSLLAWECDVALAGGVTIELPHRRGYLYEEGEILSPDGWCRPFDARAKGTVFGSGAGVVALKRLRDAVEQGDHIHAIIKGTAINNDGRRKVSFLAPSVIGQAECVTEALQVAGLSARDISYVECHGTGTQVGDPIEVAALTQAFSRWTSEVQVCCIGSVKANIGHLDTAAGIAGVFKVASMLEHEQIVPTLHFEHPNPQIDFPSTPFFVASEARPWPRNEKPRRAGVSSLGIGGTNAHIIMEEAPRRLPAGVQDGAPVQHVLLLSARSQASLEVASQRLARHLEETPELALGDVSSTLLTGRRRFPFRRVVAASSLAEATALLRTPEPSGTFDIKDTTENTPVIFLFPGNGVQHAGMAREVYRTEPVFRASMNASMAILLEKHGVDLRPVLFPEAGQEAAATAEIEHRSSLSMPALLAVEIAFARLLESWGVVASAMIGHSLGEYTAAHLAGVLTLETVLGIIHCRGRLFETIQGGGMLSVPMAAEELRPLLEVGLAIAAINAPELCVVSGARHSLDALETALTARGIEFQRLRVAAPMHSPLLAPILREFGEYMDGVTFNPIQCPYVSNLTGAFITEEDLSSDYFVRHLLETVRFTEGLEVLLRTHPQAVLIEVGPSQTLGTLVRLHPGRRPTHAIVPLAPHIKDPTSPTRFLKASAGRILAHGARIDLGALTHEQPRRVVPLPPTPFEHQRHWIEPGKGYFFGSDAPGGALSSGSDRARGEAERHGAGQRPASKSNGSPPAREAADHGRVNAPRDSVEKTLASMWEALLGVEGIDVRANFFELGGHSILAVRMFASIKRVYGVDLPISVLFKAPTIETCAALLRLEMVKSTPAMEEAAAATATATATATAAATATSPAVALERPYAYLVPIHRNNGGLPFFCVHGAGGNVLNLRALSRTLGDQTFYGLQAPGVEGGATATSIEEMAELYLHDILDAHPRGPYLLGGYSGGGVIAYEMAQRLRAAGHEVPLVAFMDTFHPGTSAQQPSMSERREEIRREGAAWLTVRGKHKLSRHLSELRDAFRIRYYTGKNLPLPIELREIHLMNAFESVAAHYEPHAYDGRVTLFRAESIEAVYRHTGPMLGWEGLIPHLDVIEVPGDHDSLVLDPNVQTLARHLTRQIAEAAGAA